MWRTERKIRGGRGLVPKVGRAIQQEALAPGTEEKWRNGRHGNSASRAGSDACAQPCVGSPSAQWNLMKSTALAVNQPIPQGLREGEQPDQGVTARKGRGGRR